MKKTCEIEGCKNPLSSIDRCDKHMFVECPECGSEQADMGKNVSCEQCGYYPMPNF